MEEVGSAAATSGKGPDNRRVNFLEAIATEWQYDLDKQELRQFMLSVWKFYRFACQLDYWFNPDGPETMCTKDCAKGIENLGNEWLPDYLPNEKDLRGLETCISQLLSTKRARTGARLPRKDSTISLQTQRDGNWEKSLVEKKWCSNHNKGV